MPAAVRIERASIADVPRMVQLLGELFRIERDFTADPRKQETGLVRLLKDEDHACVLVARSSDDDVVGMVTSQLVISTSEGAPSAWIEDMVVSQSCRRQGVGGALLAAILDWSRSRGATRAQLLVDTTNAPALTYYQRLNWQVTQLAARRVRL